MRTLLLLMLLCPVIALQAQVPGYMGRKFSVKYDCGLMHPVIVGRPGKLPMVFNNLSLDYVIGRAWTAGVKYGFMTYNAPPEDRYFYDSAPHVDYSSNRYDHKQRYMQHTVALVFKKYLKGRGYLAPIGRYWSLGVYYQYVSNTVATNVIDESSTLMYFRGRSHLPGIFFGLGREYVVANRLLLDVGMNLNFALYYVVRPYENKGPAAIFREAFGRNLLQVYLGFGALAF